MEESVKEDGSAGEVVVIFHCYCFYCFFVVVEREAGDIFSVLSAIVIQLWGTEQHSYQSALASSVSSFLCSVSITT